MITEEENEFLNLKITNCPCRLLDNENHKNTCVLHGIVDCNVLIDQKKCELLKLYFGKTCETDKSHSGFYYELKEYLREKD